MATTFVAAAHFDSLSDANPVCNKPTGTADNDIMFAALKFVNTASVSSPPSGWASLGTINDAGTSGTIMQVYWKLAASEGASYTFGLSAATRVGITIATYRSGFDTADPIDGSSNGTYFNNDTTLRATTVTVSANDSAAIFLGGIHNSSALTFTAPTGFAEDVDTGGNDLGRFYRTVCNGELDAGASGSIDATISSAIAAKYAFLVVLNPASGDPAPSITDVDEDNTVTLEQANVEIDGTDFDTATVDLEQGSETYSLSIDSQNATAIVFDMEAVPGVAPKHGAATIRVTNGDDQDDTQAITIAADAATDYVDIGTVATPGGGIEILEFDPTLDTGDQVQWRVTDVLFDETDFNVNDDATFDITVGLDPADVECRRWDDTNSTWSDWAAIEISAGSEFSSGGGRKRDSRRRGLLNLLWGRG